MDLAEILNRASFGLVQKINGGFFHISERGQRYDKKTAKIEKAKSHLTKNSLFLFIKLTEKNLH